MLRYRYFGSSNLVYLLLISCAIISRTRNVSQPSFSFIMNYGLPNDSEHWASPITLTDNLSTTSIMCHFQSAFVNMPSHSPNQSRILRQLDRSSHVRLALLMILAGDIASNPGPSTTARKPKHPCVHCSKGVISRSRAISCDNCERWVHSRCTQILTDAEYDNIVATNAELNYLCNICSFDELPFANIDDDQNTTNSNPGNENGSSNFNPSDEQFSSFFDCFKQKGLHFIHINIRSLTSKISELKIIANNSSASVIAISETWLDSSVTDAEININGYTVIRADRNREGGGVCMYINPNSP